MFVPRGVGISGSLTPSSPVLTPSSLSLGLLSQPALPTASSIYLGSDPAYNGPRSKLKAAPAAWVVGSSDQRSLRQSEDRTPSYDLICTNQRRLNADIYSEDVDHLVTIT